jgi:LuxR family transcriptional regulator, maltose regulon positive regulatory protein
MEGHTRRAPKIRPGVVSRSALLTRLLEAREPLITVVAPPGYGKTTLLAQWAWRTERLVAWVSCEESDNDPAALWGSVVSELAQVASLDRTAFDLLATSGGGVATVPRLVSALQQIGAPLTLVLDHVEVLTSPECRTSLAEFALRVPPGWQVALASREAAPVPLSRLRLEGGVVEIGAHDLAMTRDEASDLLARTGVELSDEETDQLVERTEGWPAGLYLAALALRSGDEASAFSFTGDDRLMVDYLRSELMTQVSPAEASFLARTSVLDRMSGPLCDATLGISGAARILESLEGRNLLVVPLDRRGEWYRYHHLLRELLGSELKRANPEEVPRLHARAATWLAANQMPEVAVDHAMAAGDAQEVARMVLELMQPVWATGRVDTVQRWMEWLGARPPVHYYPAIAAHGALTFALLGRASEAEQWAATAETLPCGGTLPDGSTEAATLAYLRAILCRDGPAVARQDAEAAFDGLAPASPFRSTMLHTEGISHFIEGDAHRADGVLEHAYGLAAASNAMPLAALVLAERCVVAAERGDWTTAETLIRQALEIVDTGHFEGYWTSALVFASAARCFAHLGDIPDARQYARRAARLRPLLTYALPVVSAQALLELARTYMALADPGGANAALEQVDSIVRQRSRLGRLPAMATGLRRRLAQINAAPPIGASSLTAAELRLLPLLSTHLSFPEISERLFVSRHTVKTQVASVYRKLGVSSRAEAVDRIVALGLTG